MSSRHLPRVISGRGKSQLELEREQFEKNQTIAINKAINTQETPVKEKHLRNTILGTFTDHGGGLFWQVTTRLPLQASPIVCWKFCHVLHKLLQEGHPSVLTDSQKYTTYLDELGKLWGHLRDGYGRLIAQYTALVNQILVFHRKNPEIPGNLMMIDDKFARICGSDVNSYFEISVDMLDYMDEVLHLQHLVFASLDMSRSNSMTSSGQCRLAPLILCILDSCQLYDFIVKSLFKLHSSLPPDTLCGHRDRFLSQYKQLKQFYFNSANLQYFKNLVQVPTLPDVPGHHSVPTLPAPAAAAGVKVTHLGRAFRKLNLREPPNFLIQSDFSKHVTPVVIVPEPQPDRDTGTDTDSVEDLIDTSDPPQEDRFEAAFGSNLSSFSFNGGPSDIDERDLVIERLQKQIQLLQAELEQVKAEDEQLISSLRQQVARLEKAVCELRGSLDTSHAQTDALKLELDQARVHIGAAHKLTETEKLSKSNEDKFKKMKDVYQKLRDEHVILLRQYADATKQLGAEKKLLEGKEQIIKEEAADRVRLEAERQLIQTSFQQSADGVTRQLADTAATNKDLEAAKQKLESELKCAQSEKEAMAVELGQFTSQAGSLESQLATARDDKDCMEQHLKAELRDTQARLKTLQDDHDRLETDLQQQISTLQVQLSASESQLQAREAELMAQLDGRQAALDSLALDKQQSERNLTSTIEELHRRLLSGSIVEGRSFIEDVLAQFENATFTGVRCAAEFLLSRGGPVLQCLNQLTEAHTTYSSHGTDVEKLVEYITGFSHNLSDCVMHGLATAQSSAQIESGQELSNLCRAAGEGGLDLLDAIHNGAIPAAVLAEVVDSVDGIMRLATELVPRTDDVKVEEIADMVDSEMGMTSKAIEMAAARIQEVLEKARESSSGVHLEVNERILDTCTGLMKAIKILVERSRDLQQEIVAQGRGTSTAKDFYKKNHRWTEGFISAAKAVGWGATTLVEAADKVVKGEGKLEELIVCSQEIAASTAQLVVSSRVKSKRTSSTLVKVQEASKGVSTATGSVVASVKTGAQIIEDQGLMDFSHLSLIQTKKQEMDSQVRVLELEHELELEHSKLGRLRKQHYQLAADSEGLEET